MMSIIDFCSICFPKKKSIKKGGKKHSGPKPNDFVPWFHGFC